MKIFSFKKNKVIKETRGNFGLSWKKRFANFLVRNKKKIIIRAVIALVNLILIGGGIYLYDRYVSSLFVGVITVDSQPSGAKVFINGQEKGETPLVLKKVRAGKYKVKLTKDNYRTYETEIRVNFLKETKVETVLNWASGKVRINSIPEGADIFVDGKYKRKTPVILDDLLFGHEYTITFAMDLYKNKELKIRVKMEDQELNINLSKWQMVYSQDGVVYISDINGQERKALTNKSMGNFNKVRISDDGKLVLALKEVSLGTTSSMYINRIGYYPYVINLENDKVTQIYSNYVDGYSINWIPKSHSIGFSTVSLDEFYSRNRDLWIINADDFKLKQIEIKISDKGYLSSFKWSHDGTKVGYYYHGQQASYTELYITDINTNKITIISDFMTAYDYYWSPDDKFLYSAVLNRDYIIQSNPNFKKYQPDTFNLLKVDVSTGQISSIKENIISNVNKAVYSPDCKNVVYYEIDKNLLDGKEQNEIRLEDHKVMFLNIESGNSQEIFIDANQTKDKNFKWSQDSKNLMLISTNKKSKNLEIRYIKIEGDLETIKLDDIKVEKDVTSSIFYYDDSSFLWSPNSKHGFLSIRKTRSDYNIARSIFHIDTNKKTSFEINKTNFVSSDSLISREYSVAYAFN